MTHSRTHVSHTKTNSHSKAHHSDAHSLADTVSDVHEAVVHRVEGLTDTVRSTIQEKPLQSLGIALGTGVLLSLLIRK